jgi:putative endonuclease
MQTVNIVFRLLPLTRGHDCLASLVDVEHQLGCLVRVVAEKLLEDPHHVAHEVYRIVPNYDDPNGIGPKELILIWPVYLNWGCFCHTIRLTLPAVTNQGLKVSGEDAAATLREEKGMRIVARNFRLRFGELDIVAMDGTTLVFVEVKARSKGDLIDPYEAVDHTKQAKLRRLAEAFIALRQDSFDECRFDVVSVMCNEPEAKIKVDHLEDAF